MNITNIGIAGGIFAILTLLHFIADWLFQSHQEAMTKHNNKWVRARHCLVYTSFFVGFLLAFNMSWLGLFLSLNILFWTHFYLDTYHAVFLWAKYIRKPPEMSNPWLDSYADIDGTVQIKVGPPDPVKGFKKFVETPLGKILMISVDQISHLICLIPIVYMIMSSL